MALKPIKLGGFIDENIKAVNDNFASLELNKANIADLATVLKFKGTKETISQLPTIDNVVGNVYFITEKSSEWAWNGIAWVELGSVFNIPEYHLPVAGNELGGVKNGGNVTINADGTMTAPTTQAITAVKVMFTVSDARWGAMIDNKYTLTVPSENKSPISVYRKNNTEYSLVDAGITADGTNIKVSSYDKFEGYILMI